MNIFKITVNCGWANNTSMESAEIEEIFNLLNNCVLEPRGKTNRKQFACDSREIRCIKGNGCIKIRKS